MVLSVISFMQSPCQPLPFFLFLKADERAGQHQLNLSGAVCPKGMQFLEMGAAPWSVSPPGSTSVPHQGIFLLAPGDRRRRREEDGSRGFPQGGWERGCGEHRKREGTVSMAGHREGESRGIFLFVCLYLHFSWNNCFGF